MYVWIGFSVPNNNQVNSLHFNPIQVIIALKTSIPITLKFYIHSYWNELRLTILLVWNVHMTWLPIISMNEMLSPSWARCMYKLTFNVHSNYLTSLHLDLIEANLAFKTQYYVKLLPIPLSFKSTSIHFHLQDLVSQIICIEWIHFNVWNNCLPFFTANKPNIKVNSI